MNVRLFVVASCFGAALAASQPRADVGKDQSALDALVAVRKYATAAAYIADRPELRSQPRFVRQLSHLLVTYYAMTINFGQFALRDLVEGEDIEKIRGTPGAYKMIGGDLEKLLHEALARQPDDPDIQFAVGEYLSRGKACGCADPQLFKGESADDYPYFERARRAGIYDDWSLFRMGLHHMNGDEASLRKAAALFDESLALRPDQTYASYDAAITDYWLKDYQSALKHSTRALGAYGKPELDADTYNVHARIELALGEAGAAEKAFQRALELRPWHADAFSGLLDLLRAQKRFDDYRRRAEALIALDYANTYPFDVYLGYLSNAGLTDADRELARALAERKYARDEEIGAVFYGLGRLAELASDRALAHERYARSLAALRRLQQPPKGSIEALTALVERTRTKK